jgi:peptidoglycan/xylan/chitin deacetylase (PgdA/CDA1 family)
LNSEWVITHSWLLGSSNMYLRGGGAGSVAVPSELPGPALPAVGAMLPASVKAGATHVRSALWLARRRGRLDGNGLRILFYHRVSDDEDLLAVTPRRFRRQMELLAAEGYDVVSLEVAADLLDARVTPQRTVVLNFDDGYLDVAENALPVLEDLGFPATVFLPTGAIDGTTKLSWYRTQPPLLGWDEIGELDRRGTLRFEAHTVTHPNLLALGEDAARAEIAGSKMALEERLGRPVDAFCYPAGLFGSRDRGFVADAGFRIAVSCEPGVNRPGADLLALRRRQIDARDAMLDFRAKLGGGHDSPLPLRNVYRRMRFGERQPVASGRRIAA